MEQRRKAPLRLLNNRAQTPKDIAGALNALLADVFALCPAPFQLFCIHLNPDSQNW